MELNKFEKIKNIGRYIKESFLGLPQQYKWYVTGGLVVLALLWSVYAFSNTDRAYNVLVNDKKIAVVEDQGRAKDLLKATIAEKAKEIGQKVEVTDKITYQKTTAKNIDLDGSYTLKRKYEQNLNFVTTGTAIIANNEEKLVMVNKKTAENAINQAAQSYIADYKNVKIEKVEYIDKVEFVDKKTNLKDITKENDAINLFKQGRPKTVAYHVAQGDSVWSIARQNDMYVNQIQDANPGLNIEKLKLGQEIKLTKIEPLLKFRVFARATATEVIAYNIKIINDPSLNSRQVKQKGDTGSKEVTYDLVIVNGTLEGKNVVDEKVVKQPQDELVAQNSNLFIASRGGNGGGMLSWPVRGPIPPGGYFDSPRGNGKHHAIDIDAPIGTPIGAAADGTVTFVGWSGGYGKFISIDHGNGLVTQYGHLSRFNISAGARVSRGQIIGYVGSTGYSTGPHLHLNVIVNGSFRNPLNYLR